MYNVDDEDLFGYCVTCPDCGWIGASSELLIIKNHDPNMALSLKIVSAFNAYSGNGYYNNRTYRVCPACENRKSFFRLRSIR